MGRTISLLNQKGGVGKTTTSINLGAALAELGRRVLLVDFDPQGAATVGVGINPNELDVTIYNLLLDRSLDPASVVVKSPKTGVEILPANIDLAAAEVVLVSEVAREQALLRALRPIRDEYDIVLVDCPPSLGLLTINALTASDGVIIPMECEFFALRGMALLIDTVEKVKDRLNPQLKIDGIVATMYDGRTVHAREVLDRVRQAFGDTLFRTKIHRTIKFAEAPVVGEAILTYAPASVGAADYRALAKEVLGIDDEESEPAGGGGAVQTNEPQLPLPDDTGAAVSGVGDGGDPYHAPSDRPDPSSGPDGTVSAGGDTSSSGDGGTGGAPHERYGDESPEPFIYG